MHAHRVLFSAGLITAFCIQPVAAASPLIFTEGAQAAPRIVEMEEKSRDPGITAGVITLGSTYLALPILITSLAGLNPVVATGVGAVGLPVALGSGHIYAGDPVRGIGLGALAYPVTLGGAIAGYLAALPFLDPKGYLPGVMEAIIIGLASGTAYSLCVAWDATQTPLRTLSKQDRKQPQKSPVIEWGD